MKHSFYSPKEKELIIGLLSQGLSHRDMFTWIISLKLDSKKAGVTFTGEETG